MGVDSWALVAGPHDTIIAAGTAFLDIMLLVLMMVELAYTVTVSLRGTVLAAEPFLIVGLIAAVIVVILTSTGTSISSLFGVVESAVASAAG